MEAHRHKITHLEKTGGDSLVTAVEPRRLSSREWSSRTESGADLDAGGTRLGYVSTHMVLCDCPSVQKQNQEKLAME